jgi:predicted 3-demethylubiquinone-9 3-methyltransferase (glyoxalase superfamily)
MAQKLTPFLWFDGRAEEAAEFYTSVFPGAKITGIQRAGDDGPVIVASFELFGQQFAALNGGPDFAFTEAISFQIDCESQDEVDYYWGKLLDDGGEPSQCGWLKDKFGVSWQVVPRRLMELLQDEDSERANRVMQSMLGMVKIEIPELERAYAGG